MREKILEFMKKNKMAEPGDVLCVGFSGGADSVCLLLLLEELSRELDIPLKDVAEAMDAVCAPMSLYDPVYADGGDPLTVMDQVRDTRNTDEQWMEHIALRDAFNTLSPREKQILCLRFYDGKTQMEVAGSLGISQAQVSRLEKNAIAAMRKKVSIISS